MSDIPDTTDAESSASDERAQCEDDAPVPASAAPVPATRSPKPMGRIDKLPIKMLQDRLMVQLDGAEGERRSSGGILIPATAKMARRLVWGEVVALGPNVRAAESGDKVLFSPDDRYEVEVGGEEFTMLRERDLHAVAAARNETNTGLYL